VPCSCTRSSASPDAESVRIGECALFVHEEFRIP
jgi:hypothetical protein